MLMVIVSFVCALEWPFRHRYAPAAVLFSLGALQEHGQARTLF